MFITNYKQVATLILESDDPTVVKDYNQAKEYYRQNSTLDYVPFNTNIITTYRFKVQLPTQKYTKNTRMAVASFNIINQYIEDFNVRVGQPSTAAIGTVYMRNIRRPNLYSKDNTKGTPILTLPIGRTSYSYNNTDLIHNSIDITNNTGFLEGNPLEISVHLNVTANDNTVPFGCPENSAWQLTLYIYEEEKEENKKDMVDDNVQPYSRPPTYNNRLSHNDVY
jgi:hypothetical protein